MKQKPETEESYPTLKRYVRALSNESAQLKARIIELENNFNQAYQELTALNRTMVQRWIAPHLEQPPYDTPVLMLLQRKDGSRQRLLGCRDDHRGWYIIGGMSVAPPDYWEVIGWMALPPER